MRMPERLSWRSDEHVGDAVAHHRVAPVGRPPEPQRERHHHRHDDGDRDERQHRAHREEDHGDDHQREALHGEVDQAVLEQLGEVLDVARHAGHEHARLLVGEEVERQALEVGEHPDPQLVHELLAEAPGVARCGRGSAAMFDDDRHEVQRPPSATRNRKSPWRMPSSMPSWVSSGPGLLGDGLEHHEHAGEGRAAGGGRRRKRAQGERLGSASLRTWVNGTSVSGCSGSSARSVSTFSASSGGMPAKGSPAAAACAELLPAPAATGPNAISPPPVAGREPAAADPAAGPPAPGRPPPTPRSGAGTQVVLVGISAGLGAGSSAWASTSA